MVRHTCYRCFRPETQCFCEHIPAIDNQTRVLILQHIGERDHPFNTARIVNQALKHADWVVAHNKHFGNRRLPILPNAGLLYPQPDAQLLSDLPPAEHLRQLVVIDGTWHQAKTIVRDAPQLRNLPRFRIHPASPGQYRIRREPDERSLSTLEATVAALRALEPDTAGLDALLAAFHSMVDTQIKHSQQAHWRTRHIEHRPKHVPRALLGNAHRIVVAYGEATPWSHREGAPCPVNWIAKRLGSGEQFYQLRSQPNPLPPSSIQHMGLSGASFESALTDPQFCEHWHGFVRPGDTLVVYHSRTAQLLKNLGATLPRCLVLKSIFAARGAEFRSLEGLLESEGLALPANGPTRAHRRLEMAVRLVKHLRRS